MPLVRSSTRSLFHTCGRSFSGNRDFLEASDKCKKKLWKLYPGVLQLPLAKMVLHTSVNTAVPTVVCGAANGGGTNQDRRHVWSFSSRGHLGRGKGKQTTITSGGILCRLGRFGRHFSDLESGAELTNNRARKCKSDSPFPIVGRLLRAIE